MRLLHTSQLVVREFLDEKIPAYAILSHTWGNEEVTLQELCQERSKSKEGYKKIAQCCKLAASEGWQYVWIDTCCIDKTSSAELSEAINSMYRWYQRAEVCYAYLSDINKDNIESVADTFIGFSRWFTRGWTLQELIAPASLVFYDQNWKEIGTKWSLRHEISRATGISRDHMVDHRAASIAVKMSWASKRKTSRIEDTAYCLLGLFDLSIPLLYGEGEKAFMRLQHEILQTYEYDETIFAWADESLDCSGLLARSPAAFASSGDTVPIEKSRPNASSFTLSRKTITITSARRDANRYVHVLNCAPKSNPSKPIRVILRAEPSGRFIREAPHTLCVGSVFRKHNGTYPIEVWLEFAMSSKTPKLLNFLIKLPALGAEFRLVQKFPEELDLKQLGDSSCILKTEHDFVCLLYIAPNMGSFALVLDLEEDLPGLHVIVPNIKEMESTAILCKTLISRTKALSRELRAGPDQASNTLQSGAQLRVRLRRRVDADWKYYLINAVIRTPPPPST